MIDHQSSQKPINEEIESSISEYKSFDEFKEYSNEQILEIDQFLKSYAELIYNCHSSELKTESRKVIEMNTNQNNLKAA